MCYLSASINIYYFSCYHYLYLLVFSFGRDGEEIEYVQKFGIETAIVPGISSSLTVPAANGISLTQRGISESFLGNYLNNFRLQIVQRHGFGVTIPGNGSHFDGNE